MPRRLIALACALFLVASFLAGSAAAQSALQSPSAFLGYELGTQFTPHHRVLDYLEHLAQASPRVQLEPYGTSYEGRSLLVAYVGTPAHLQRLDAIRAANLARVTGEGLDRRAASEGPAVVWLSYNVHGNESVSTEAALQVLYRLANGGDDRTRMWLDEVVVVVDPCVNPDGRDRYVHWYQQTRGAQPNPEPDAREHHEPWPGGRTNHYYFDLNRDWAWATQQETQQRLVLYNRWMPHVHADYHEQGVEEPYYFAPAAEPFHPRITDWQRQFQTAIGRLNARTFDAAGWLYFTGERFDLFYPGYGDTWPTFNGAVGMTYEQGGSGRAGLAIRTAEGDTLTLTERIRHHVATSLATIEATAQNRAQVLAEFTNYFAQSRQQPAPYGTYLVKATDPDKLAALTALLDAQGIRYGTATQQRRTRGRAYPTGASNVTVEPGDLLVPAIQPKGVLANVLFEPEAVLADSLSYDITAWALPYVYGVEAYALDERLAPGQSGYAPPEARVTGAARPYAYVAEWTSFADARLLAAWLRAGLKPRFVMQPFTVGGRRYGRGTLLVTRAGHQALGDRFDALVRETAAAHGQPLHGLASGFVDEGADLGSSNVTFLRTPRVAALAGPPLSAQAVGEVWHYFERQLGYPLTLLRPDDLADLVLADYDVLLLPHGRYGEVLAGSTLDKVRAWIEQGGRLVALEGAAAFLAGQDGFGLTRKDADDSGGDDEADPVQPFAERERQAIAGEVPGAIFRAELDPTHPLAFGYGRRYFTLKRGAEAFAFLDDGWNVGVLREGAPVSGFAGAETAGLLENSLVFGVQQHGRGEVVYLLDNPLFRAFWENGKLLMANAVFVVGQRTPRR